jgi:hypothetical protein
MMTLVLIWLALSVVLGACVCRLLALSGPTATIASRTSTTTIGVSSMRPSLEAGL